MTNQTIIERIEESWQFREIKLIIDNTAYYYNRLQQINEHIKRRLFTTDNYLHEEFKTIRNLRAEYRALIDTVIDYSNNHSDEEIRFTSTEKNAASIALYLREIQEIKFNLTTNLRAINTINKIVYNK